MLRVYSRVSWIQVISQYVPPSMFDPPWSILNAQSHSPVHTQLHLRAPFTNVKGLSRTYCTVQLFVLLNSRSTRSQLNGNRELKFGLHIGSSRPFAMSLKSCYDFLRCSCYPASTIFPSLPNSEMGKLLTS